jgi:nicotinate phosphoribosyltransferase
MAEKMVRSLLDTDVYKFTTSYAYMKNYPDAEGEFSFVDRNKTEFSIDDIEDLKSHLYRLGELSLSNFEMEWCVKNIPFIPRYYWEWLRGFRFDVKKINIDSDVHGHLQITVYDKLYKVTLYEVPILAIVSEWMSMKYKDMANIANIEKVVLEKITMAALGSFKFSEFGTRRRFSYDVQDKVISVLANKGWNVCNGTSNVHFAMKYNMKVMGTHPHEWFMFHGAQFGYKHANYLGMDTWMNTYRGDLGIALTDTYTSDVFFRNFSKVHAKLFDGIRQDSGDEYEFTDKAIARYNELGINPLTKTIIFSNALDFVKAGQIAEYCRGKIGFAFGIGTNLTNDLGVPHANIVMKLTKCKMNERQPEEYTIKLSDDLGKHLGPIEEVEIAKKTLNIK